jgi:alkylation response protein AidB-like acyl-CoA dehydrogenase
MIDLAIVAEELGRAAAPGPFFGHSLACIAIAHGGSEEQKSKWLPRLASGECIGSIAFAEADGRWQPNDWQLPDAELLNGEKIFVPYADTADVIVVGCRGGELALLETSGIDLNYTAINVGDRTRRLHRIFFANAPAQLLGTGTDSIRVRDAALILLAADAFGGASRCVDMAVDYAKTREQFGQSIGQFQALKHQLADMAVEIEPARGLYWFAAHAWDHLPEQAERSAALAKAHLTDRYLQIARNTVEAHGGIGYTWECDVQILVKRAMFDFSFCGSPASHRARCAALSVW